MAPDAATRARLGVYPGSFDPPTIAHVHIAERAIEQCGLDRLDLVISAVTLGKTDEMLRPRDFRVAELQQLADGHRALAVRTTEHSLLADIAEGYDVVVMGADKWAQVLDVVWYDGIAGRDAALHRLPTVALAPRPPWPRPGEDPAADPPAGVEFILLDTDPIHHEVSATAVRAGRTDWRARPPQHDPAHPILNTGTVRDHASRRRPVQCSGDPAEDRARAAALIDEAAAQGAELIALPELFASLGRTDAIRATAEPLFGPTFDWVAALAVHHRRTLLAGSIVERVDDRLFNTSLLVGPQGDLLAHYRKVHLFDVEVDGATSRESDTFSPGDEAVVAQLPDGTPLGLTICYDLRFPELFRIEAVRGARIIAVPSAFTAVTGSDHWEVLVRARAIENQVGILAPAQWGTSPDGITRHGHALIVDAWGTVLAEAPAAGDVVLVAELDPGEGDRVRRRLPSLANRRPGAYRWPDRTS